MAPGPLNVRYEADMTLDVFRARFRVLNIVDDVTWECFAAIPDTSISGRRVEVNRPSWSAAAASRRRSADVAVKSTARALRIVARCNLPGCIRDYPHLREPSFPSQVVEFVALQQILILDSECAANGAGM